LASLDRHAMLDLDSTLALLRAAKRADFTFFPAHFDYIALMRRRASMNELRREYPSERATDDPIAECLAAVVRASTSARSTIVRHLERIEARFGSTPCTAVYLTELSGTADTASLARSIRYGRRAVETAPLITDVWNAYGFALWRLGRITESDAVVRSGLSQVPHPMGRLSLELARAAWRSAAGDTLGANTIFRAEAQVAQRDGRPGLWAMYLSAANGSTVSRDSVWRTIVRLARARGDWLEEAGAIGSEILARLDYDGQPGSALKLCDRLIALMESVHKPLLEADAYTKRGRMLSKMGRRREAERDLLRAIRLAGGQDGPEIMGQAYHNLAHVYESDGDWTRATRAVDRFVEESRPLASAATVVSLRDAGLIRWKAGWHAAARVDFEEMVRLINERQLDFIWAGEYYERNGDLRQALSYYTRGVRTSEGPQCLAGMARVYDALGIPDSAEMAARRHDAFAGSWQDGALLPRILARRGRLDEAARDSRAWVDRLTAGGNIEGAVTALLARSEILLDGQRPGEALVDAVQADSLATGLHLVDKAIGALRLRGSALMALGHGSDGLALLEKAATLAAQHPTTESVLTTNLALADALADVNRTTEAMKAYDRAGKAVERVVHLLGTDPDRTTYRAGHLAPFDGAVLTLLRAHSDTLHLDELVRWSQRRKAVALAMAVGLHADDALMRRAAALSLRQIQSRIGEKEAFVDFIVADRSVAVLVVRHDSARLVRLTTPVDSLRRWAEQLTRPFHAVSAGRIDISRAPYDLRIAADLYASLLAPLRQSLGGVTRLLISPDGPLHAVPFEALVVGGSSTDPLRADRYRVAKYIVDQFEVVYLPSARFLVRGDRERALSRTGRLLALGYGVVGGDHELAAIRAAWPGSVGVLSGSAATETAVRHAGSGIAVLHFATHATADDHDPLASHLSLAADRENDGLFHLSEITAAHIASELVVLSGCETLGNRLYEGEGFMGLARAFLIGGARSVAATQWPVGPATADLMDQFYRRLATGSDPVTALRDAKLALRRDAVTAHPFFWAGFVIVKGG
jgi:CHAT domain-containing protein